MSPSATDAKTSQSATLTPVIVRIMNNMTTPMYFTGYDGTDVGAPSPVILPGNGTFTDICNFFNGADRWDWLYLGHDQDGHSLTIYFKQDGQGRLTTTIGKYEGRREPPGKLDPKYATAHPLFFDGYGNIIMQFNLLSYVNLEKK